MSHNTTGGSYRTTTALMMAAFDKLPPEARRALAGAADNWVPQPLLRRYRRGRWDACVIIVTITRWNKQELAKREEQRRRAIGPYRGNAPDDAGKLTKRARR